MIQIPKRLPRHPGPTATVEELARHGRHVEEELTRRLTEVAERVEDRYDEVSFESGGKDVEVRISNPFDWTPNRFSVCDVVGAYAVGWGRPARANESWIYLTSDAPKGTRICVKMSRVSE